MFRSFAVTAGAVRCSLFVVPLFCSFREFQEPLRSKDLAEDMRKNPEERGGRMARRRLQNHPGVLQKGPMLL